MWDTQSLDNMKKEYREILLRMFEGKPFKRDEAILQLLDVYISLQDRIDIVKEVYLASNKYKRQRMRNYLEKRNYRYGGYNDLY